MKHNNKYNPGFIRSLEHPTYEPYSFNKENNIKKHIGHHFYQTGFFFTRHKRNNYHYKIQSKQRCKKFVIQYEFFFKHRN